MPGTRMVVPFPCLRDRMEGGEIGAWGHPWGQRWRDGTSREWVAVRP
jgi:hypothetical protein